MECGLQSRLLRKLMKMNWNFKRVEDLNIRNFCWNKGYENVLQLYIVTTLSG